MVSITVPAWQKKNPFAFTLPTGAVFGSLGTKMFGTGARVVAPSTIIKSVGSNWKPIAIAGGGVLAGYGISSIFGKEKKQEQQQQLSQQQQPIQITKTISPVTTTTNTNTYANTYQIAENSPGAYLGMEKKDAISTSPSVGVSPAWSISPSQAASQGASQKAEQSDMGGLLVPAAIIGIALVASGYLKGRKGRK